MKIMQAYELFLSRSNYRDSTVATYRRAVKFFVKWFGDMEITTVKYGHAEDFQNLLCKEGRIRRSEKTVNLYTIAMHKFFDWAVKREYILRNPFSELKMLPEIDKSFDCYTGAQLERMLQVADNRFKVIILFGKLGLRRGETLNLIVSDLQFDKELVAITSKKDTTETWLWDIKNRKQAFAPMPECIALPSGAINFHSILTELIFSLPVGQPYLCVKPAEYQKNMLLKKEDLLNYERRLEPWSNFNRDFRKVLKQAHVKVPRLRFQDLRGTFANDLAVNGFGLKEAQIAMRHKSIQTTAIYYRRVDEKNLLKKAVELQKHYVS